jgi:hypothetical protein
MELNTAPKMAAIQHHSGGGESKVEIKKIIKQIESF